MLLYVFLYALTLIVSHPALTLASQLVLFIAVVITFPVLSRTNFVISLTLTLIGFALLIINSVPPSLWLTAFAQNSAVAAIFITIPMLSIPFHYGEYQKDLKNFMQKHVSSPWLFCVIVWLITHLFGVIILIGVVPLMFALFYEQAKQYGAEKEFTSTISHAQLSGGFWSPAWSSIVIILYTLRIPWISIVPIGLTLTLIFFICSILWIRTSLKRSGAHRVVNETTSEIHFGGVAMVALITLLPIILIILTNTVLNLSITAAIPLIALTYPVIMALILGRWNRYRSGMKVYIGTSILNVKNELVLLTAAGFFGKTLQLAGIESLVNRMLPQNISQYPFITILSILAVFVVTVHLGMHPIVAGSALVVSVRPELIGLSPLMFAMVLLSGWALGTLISPFSASNIVVGGLTGRPSWHISTKMHGLFSLTMIILLSGVMAVFTRFC